MIDVVMAVQASTQTISKVETAAADASCISYSSKMEVSQASCHHFTTFKLKTEKLAEAFKKHSLADAEQLLCLNLVRHFKTLIRF